MFYILEDECLSRCPIERSLAYARLLGTSYGSRLTKTVSLFTAILLAISSFLLGIFTVSVIAICWSTFRRQSSTVLSRISDRSRLMSPFN
ncbi:hypothetical protein AB6A40_011553 [Gnathostoma spinigerum]|uniref:Uncharacterized protein n=1 Tax=Gnathostoma spinigerum TaxID=75299 RepID=A0ABD6F3K9_9BILA